MMWLYWVSVSVAAGVLVVVIITFLPKVAVRIREQRKTAIAAKRQDTADRLDNVASDAMTDARRTYLQELERDGQIVVTRHRHDPNAPGATIAEYSDGSYTVHFNGNVPAYRRFVERSPSDALEVRSTSPHRFAM